MGLAVRDADYRVQFALPAGVAIGQGREMGEDLDELQQALDEGSRQHRAAHKQSARHEQEYHKPSASVRQRS